MALAPRPGLNQSMPGNHMSLPRLGAFGRRATATEAAVWHTHDLSLCYCARCGATGGDGASGTDCTGWLWD